MYQSQHFVEARLEVLHALIRAHSLATLVTLRAGGLAADHIPLLIDPAPAPFGTLRGHVARANPLWHECAQGSAVLAVFSGPQTYISPALYPSKQEHGKVVPTWNYAVVHAHGTLRVHDDVQWLRLLVTALTDENEVKRDAPWRVSDAPDDYINTMLKGIVGIEIPIDRLEGKWKVSQNRLERDRAGVVNGLRSHGDADGQAMADLVEESLRGEIGR